MKIKKQKSFSNGTVYCLELEDGKLIETTDTSMMRTNGYTPLYIDKLLSDKRTKEMQPSGKRQKGMPRKTYREFKND